MAGTRAQSGDRHGSGTLHSRQYIYIYIYIYIYTYIYIHIYTYIYIRHTAQLTSRRSILNIYSTNILTEYFKHAAHSPFFSLQDAVYFIMLSFFGSCNIHILNTECAKILKKIPAPNV